MRNSVIGNWYDKIICGDCLEVMKDIPDKSIDMILCDLPYGTTQNKWDIIIDFDLLWNKYNKVIKNNGAILLFGSGLFTAKLMTSNEESYKYKWVWNKINKFSGHLNAKKQPLRIYEEIVVFYNNQCTYNPQMTQGKPYTAVSKGNKSSSFGKQIDGVRTINDGLYYPKDIINIEGDERGKVGRIHPTQKPVKLCEYLIRTYTDEGDLVLDNCIGSGTTAVACKNTNRRFIGIELKQEYVDIANKRLLDVSNN